MIKTMLIINPTAGYAKKVIKIIDSVKEKLSHNSHKLDIKKTKYAGHAVKLAEDAVKKKYDIVIAAGGDGTINEVVNGLAGSKVKLGLIPVGTANAFKNEFGIPNNLSEAIDIILKGKEKRIDLGLVESSNKKRYFALCAGIGFDAAVCKGVKPVLKRLLKKGAFYLSIIQQKLVGYKFPRLIVKANNKEYHAFTVVAMNSKYYGGSFVMDPKAKVDDGVLSIGLFTGKNVLEMIKYMVLGHINMIHHARNVKYVKVKEFEVFSSEKYNAPVHVEAEIFGETPVKIKVVPRSLSVLV